MSSNPSVKQPPVNQEFEHSEICQYYELAETAIKQSEVLCKRKPVPALNEMRYAGYHAILFSELPDGMEKEEERHKCIRHTRRAYYDANEFMILGLTGEVDAIDKQTQGYEFIVSEILGHDAYASYSKQILEARDFAMTSRLRKKDEEKWSNRDAFADQCANHAKNLAEFLHVFDTHKIAISSRISAEKDKSKGSWRNTIWGAVIGGIIATVLGKTPEIYSCVVSWLQQ
ncbi:hypothetical protein [Akkermansia sp.]|uniref:hypothetical protein n=1 Tax=Akkermansia sp. TaxID=1872421 RepID=UPI003AF9B749